MCDLFGMSCQAADRGVNSLRALGGWSDWNPHGWGVAWYDQDGRAQVRKADEDGDGDFVARKSTAFTRLIGEAESRLMVGHIRYKTCGDMCLENCHPFSRKVFERDWTFAHNGGIRGVERHPRSMGGTDSEQVFHEMMDELERYVNRPGFNGIYPGIKKAIRGVLARYSRDITFNFLLSDGTTLYAYNHYPEKPLYASQRQKGYGGAIVVSTGRLAHPDAGLSWRRVPADRLLAISDGRIHVLSNPLV